MAFGFSVMIAEEFKKFRKEWKKYALMIKEAARRYFDEKLVAVYVFGSTVKGDYDVLSDIDVAVVLSEEVDENSRAKFRSIIRDILGYVNPFEVHVVTEEEWEGWYRRFVKQFVEV